MTKVSYLDIEEYENKTVFCLFKVNTQADISKHPLLDSMNSKKENQICVSCGAHTGHYFDCEEKTTSPYGVDQ